VTPPPPRLEIRKKLFLNNLSEILNQFQSITLEEMDRVRLMNRTDTKFILNGREFLDILLTVKDHYRILEVEGNRQSRYKTLYYDTADFYHFRNHQNGKLNRFKIRKRAYVESNIAFLEVKFKSNKDRTIKKRIPLPSMQEGLLKHEMHFIEERSRMSTPLHPKLWNSFERITLVNNHSPERLTIDCNLSFQNGEDIMSLDDLVIAEVKQESESRSSPFIHELKNRIIRPEGISKYCLGVTLLYPHVKSNNFKQKLLRIKKVTTIHDPAFV
jgi:hypothetical protein